MVRGASPRRTALAVFAGGLALLLSAFLGRAGWAGDDGAQSLQQVAAPAIALQQIASGLVSVTSITNAGDARLFLTTQAGQIRIYSGGTVLATPFLDVSSSVLCCGERGLLSVAFHPQYASNGFFFIYYNNLAGDIEIARYQRSVSSANLADPATGVLLLLVPHPTNANHNGGQLQFGPDGYLYIGTGDGGSGNDPPCNAQNDNSPLGKLLRIDVDQNVSTSPFYGIPPSNPQATGAYPRNLTWAKGLRNPWRFSFDRLTRDLWIGDVGQGAWEEIDFQPRSSVGGENYGWKVMEGNHCGGGGNSGCSPVPPACFDPIYVRPVLEYDHSGGNCSVTGGYVYRGAQDAALSGVYIYGDYCSGRIWGSGQLFAPTVGALQTFGEDATGEIYIGTGAGLLYLITHPGPATPTPTSAPPTSTPTPTATPTATPEPLMSTATPTATPIATPTPAGSRPAIIRRGGSRPPPPVLTPR
jgi:glucose/arabinose dehydrogenase